MARATGGHERPLVPVHRGRADPPPPGVPGHHHLQDPVPRESGPGQSGTHAVGLPQVLRARRGAPALGAAPAAGALPAPQGDQGPPGRRFGGDWCRRRDDGPGTGLDLGRRRRPRPPVDRRRPRRLSTDDGHDALSTDDARVGDPVLVGQRVGAESEARATAVGSHPAGESPLSIVGEGSGLPGLGSPGDGPSRLDQPAAGPPPATSRASSRPTAAAPHRRGADRAPLLELVDDAAAPPGARVTAAEPAHQPGDAVPARTTSTGTAASGRPATGSAARRPKPAAEARTEPAETSTGPRAAPRAPRSPRLRPVRSRRARRPRPPRCRLRPRPGPPA